MFKKNRLTDEQRLRIYLAIGMATRYNDKRPRDIIKEDYRGNEDRYLRAMAKKHNISLD